MATKLCSDCMSGSQFSAETSYNPNRFGGNVTLTQEKSPNFICLVLITPLICLFYLDDGGGY